MWLVGSSLLVIWFILRFVLHKGGFVHVLFLTGFSLLVVQFVAYRKEAVKKSVNGFHPGRGEMFIA
jgi:cbb3-type cytochrome oxidase subunit 3